MARLDVDLKSSTDWRITIVISGYVRRANESFSRAIPRRMALLIIKKLDSEDPTWHAVQASLNRRNTATTRGRGKDRIILQIVGAGQSIAVIVRRYTAWAIKHDR